MSVRGLHSKAGRVYYAELRKRAETLREGLVVLVERITSEKVAKQRRLLEKMRMNVQSQLEDIETALSY